MTAARKRPGDVTGRQAEILAQQHADELRSRQGTIGLLTGVETVDDEVVDLTPRRAAVRNGDVEEVELAEPTVTIRVNSPIEHMTLGVGTRWDFEEGRRYQVPKSVADHLEEKGYLWH